MSKIEIVYATAKKIIEMNYSFEGQKTIECVLNDSKFLLNYSIDLNEHMIGIYGKILPLTTEVKSGDRLEIYTHLINDPKTIRRTRAKK